MDKRDGRSTGGRDLKREGHGCVERDSVEGKGFISIEGDGQGWWKFRFGLWTVERRLQFE